MHICFFRAMGFRPTAEELADLIEEIDEDGSGKHFINYCAIIIIIVENRWVY